MVLSDKKSRVVTNDLSVESTEKKESTTGSYKYSTKAERDELVIKLYKEGLSCYKIAHLLDIHRHTVTRVLKSNNIPRRKIGDYHQLRHKKIEEMYLSGKSIAEIAEKLKISTNTVEKVLEKRKIIFERNDERIIKIARYIELKKQGKTKEEIAKILGLSTKQLNRLVFNSPINITNIKNKRYSKKPLADIITEFMQGATLDQLSRRYDLKQSEIKDLLRKFGLYKL